MEDNTKNLVNKIRSNYQPKTETNLDKLRALDAKVKKPILIFAYIFGILGSLILGVGMCLAMKVIGGTTALMIVGIVVGLVGIVMVSVNYPLYVKLLENRRKKYAGEVLTLSDEILNK